MGPSCCINMRYSNNCIFSVAYFFTTSPNTSFALHTSSSISHMFVTSGAHGALSNHRGKACQQNENYRWSTANSIHKAPFCKTSARRLRPPRPLPWLGGCALPDPSLKAIPYRLQQIHYLLHSFSEARPMILPQMILFDNAGTCRAHIYRPRLIIISTS